jgi:hypothetical protein
MLRNAHAERVMFVKRRSSDASAADAIIEASQPLHDMNAAASAAAMTSELAATKFAPNCPRRKRLTPAQIICKFGVNALSSKSPNAIKLNALGRLIEGPGRPNKQRFAIPAMAQGVQPRLLTATSGTRPLRVVRGASYRGRWPLHFRLTVSTDLATLYTASPFCFWRRFFRGSGRLDAKSRAPACSPPPHRARHLCRIFIAPLRCGAQTSSKRRVAIGLRTRRPRADLPVSLAVFRVRGYPWSRHYTPEGARMRRI